MFDFVIILQNNKTRLYNRFGWLIIIANAIFFFYLAIFATEKKLQYGSITMLMLLLIIFLLQRYFKGSVYRFGLHPYFLFIMLAWFNAEVYWMAGVLFLFDILHSIAIQKLTVGFTKREITYPSFPVKKIEWHQLSNVLLKDGLLTIDFKNDTLIQQPIDESKTSVNEAEFNEFCRQQLKA